MSDRRLPREAHIRFVPNLRNGGTHNVLEVCGKDEAISARYVLAQDSETAIERDKYKLRAGLLEAELSQLRAEREWISVEDRLPELYLQVLGALKSTTGKYNLSRINRANADDYDWEADGFEIGNCWVVTHWMPLPAPPQALDKQESGRPTPATSDS